MNALRLLALALGCTLLACSVEPASGAESEPAPDAVSDTSEALCKGFAVSDTPSIPPEYANYAEIVCQMHLNALCSVKYHVFPQNFQFRVTGTADRPHYSCTASCVVCK